MLTGRAVDFRVSSQATTHARTSCCAFSTGKKDRSARRPGAGARSAAASQENDRAARGHHSPHRPDGSGKTTTLYSVLNHINNDGLNIMTLEDPVEYPMT